MICRTCIRRATALNLRRPAIPTPNFPPSLNLNFRALSISASSRTPAPPTPAGTAASPASSTAEPSTTPKLSTPVDGELSPSQTGGLEDSSAPANTVLSGLNYFKGKTDPVALPDEEYPAWLWDCLKFDAKDTNEADVNAGDEFSKSAKQRRLAAKRQKALQAKLLASGNTDALAPKVPLQEQSVNLPGEAGGDVAHNIHASDKREELRRAMRKERKTKIKESNYLKSM